MTRNNVFLHMDNLSIACFIFVCCFVTFLIGMQVGYWAGNFVNIRLQTEYIQTRLFPLTNTGNVYFYPASTTNYTSCIEYAKLTIPGKFNYTTQTYGSNHQVVENASQTIALYNQNSGYGDLYSGNYSLYDDLPISILGNKTLLCPNIEEYS